MLWWACGGLCQQKANAASHRHRGMLPASRSVQLRSHDFRPEVYAMAVLVKLQMPAAASALLCTKDYGASSPVMSRFPKDLASVE